MNNLFFSAMLLASLFAASEASQQTNPEAKSLIVILHLETTYRLTAARDLQALAKCPGFGSLALHAVTDNEDKIIFTLMPGYRFERDKVQGELERYMTYPDLPACPILKRQTLMKIIHTYNDSCPGATVVILTSGKYDQADWFDYNNTTILVVQLNENLGNSSESWNKVTPDEGYYIAERKAPIRHISKIIFGDPGACTTKSSETFIRQCIPKSKGGAYPAGGTTESSSFPIWKVVMLAVFCPVGLAVIALITIRYCTAKDSICRRKKDARAVISERGKEESQVYFESKDGDEIMRTPSTPPLGQTDVQRPLLGTEHSVITDEDENPRTPPTPPLEKNASRMLHYLVYRVFQNQYDKLKNAIPRITFPPAELGVTKTKGKIVLFGPVGHGKSSFINSVIRIAKEAPDGASEGSMTKAYNEFVCDNLLVTETMAIGPWDGLGFDIGDITYLLKGNIKKEYKFDQANPITPQSPDFNPNPSTADRVHCVILCLKAKELANIQPGYMKKIQALQDTINELNIPQIMILTNINDLCQSLTLDVNNPFEKHIVEEVTHLASQIFKIPMERIHPLHNFTREINPGPILDISYLKALKQALDFANHHLQREAL